MGGWAWSVLPQLPPPWPTCHREAGPVALPGLPAVLVLGDAAVGGECILLLQVGDVQPAMGSDKKPVFWRHNQDEGHYSLAWEAGFQPSIWYKASVRVVTVSPHISYLFAKLFPIHCFVVK